MVFGLAHELGHLNAATHPENLQRFFSESDARVALDFALRDDTIEQDLKDAIRQSAESPSSPLSPQRLIVEAYADLFAIQILISATPFLMEKEGRTANLYAVLAEVEQSMTTLWILERCKSSVQWVMRNSDYGQDVELYVPPLAFTARGALVRQPLEIAVTQTMSNDPSAENRLMARSILKQISTNWKGLVHEALAGLAAANRFVFLPNAKRALQTRAFTPRSIDLDNRSIQSQIKMFCSLIESLHGEVESARGLQNIVRSVETA